MKIIKNMFGRKKGLNKNRRGFSLTEVITGVIVLGILAGVGTAVMSNTTAAARANALQNNNTALNNAVQNLRAAGSVFTVGAWQATQGSATEPAQLRMASDGSSASSFISLLEGTGITSYGTVGRLGADVTNASYEYSFVNGVPVFTVASGATQP